MATNTVKLVFDTTDILKTLEEITALPAGLDDVAQDIFSEFCRSFLCLPSDLFICTQESAASGTGDGIIRFGIRAPKLEVLAAALSALKIGLELGHGNLQK